MFVFITIQLSSDFQKCSIREKSMSISCIMIITELRHSSMQLGVAGRALTGEQNGISFVIASIFLMTHGCVVKVQNYFCEDSKRLSQACDPNMRNWPQNQWRFCTMCSQHMHQRSAASFLFICIIWLHTGSRRKSTHHHART